MIESCAVSTRNIQLEKKQTALNKSKHYVLTNFISYILSIDKMDEFCVVD